MDEQQQVRDERILAKVIREHRNEYPPPIRQVDKDKTELARALFHIGMPKVEICEVFQVPMWKLDRILAGKRV